MSRVRGEYIAILKIRDLHIETRPKARGISHGTEPSGSASRWGRLSPPRPCCPRVAQWCLRRPGTSLPCRCPRPGPSSTVSWRPSATGSLPSASSSALLLVTASCPTRPSRLPVSHWPPYSGSSSGPVRRRPAEAWRRRNGLSSVRYGVKAGRD